MRLQTDDSTQIHTKEYDKIVSRFEKNASIAYNTFYPIFLFFKNTFLSNKLCHSQPFCCYFLVSVVLYKKQNGLLLKDANWYIPGMCFDDIVLFLLQMVVRKLFYD